MVIKLDNVDFKYNKKDLVLKNINLNLFDSKVIFILGENGSGKSTLIQHLNGLYKPSNGNIIYQIPNQKTFSINDRKIKKELRELKRYVGLVFQSPEDQIFETNIYDEVSFAPKNFLKDPQIIKEQSIKAMDRLKIYEQFYNKSPFNISGGEKRKVALASILSLESKAIIFDEPTISLDSSSKIEFNNLIRQLKQEDKLIIIVSHDIEFAYEMSDEIIYLNQGEIKYNGSSKEFFDKDIEKEFNLKTPLIYKLKKDLDINKEEIKNYHDLLEYIKDKRNE